MKPMDVLAFVLVMVMVFGPAAALAAYGFKRGKKAFARVFAEVDSARRARHTTLSTSFKLAILPALCVLFCIAWRMVRRGTAEDAEVAWQCVGAIGLILVVFVIVPFVWGVQRAYGAAISQAQQE